MGRLDLRDPFPTAKCDFPLLREGTCGLSLRGGMEEEEGAPCRRSWHNLTICLGPGGRSSPGQLQAPACALHIRHNSVPQEKLRVLKHVALTPADLRGAPQVIHRDWRNCTSLRGRAGVSIHEEARPDGSCLVYLDPNLWPSFNSYGIQNGVSFSIIKL